MRAARARNLRTVVNPAPIQYSYEQIFPLTDVALLNEVEARELGGGDDAIAAARGIHESGVGTVIVTLGAQGAMAISRSGRERMSAPSVAAVDTVGAGDVFCGALVACLARGTSLLAALRVAVEAASLSVTRRGTLSRSQA